MAGEKMLWEKMLWEKMLEASPEDWGFKIRAFDGHVKVGKKI